MNCYVEPWVHKLILRGYRVRQEVDDEPGLTLIAYLRLLMIEGAARDLGIAAPDAD